MFSKLAILRVSACNEFIEYKFDSENGCVSTTYKLGDTVK